MACLNSGKNHSQIIEKYCPLFHYTEEEKRNFFEEMKKQDSPKW